jgi:ribonuclease P protein component
VVDLPRSRRYFLPKKERLRRKRAFEYLFEHGDSLRVGVLTFFYAMDVPHDWVEAPVSVAFSAPKRKFRRAVDRNYLKRRIREAYRLHKHVLTEAMLPPGKTMILLISFRAHHLGSYHQIEQATIKGLHILRDIALSAGNGPGLSQTGR